MRITNALAKGLIAASTLIPNYQEQTKSQEPTTPVSQVSNSENRNPSAFSIEDIQKNQLHERGDSQPISRWVIRYTVQYNGDKELEQISASDISLKYDAWVANSRCPSHAIPKKSHAEFTLAEANPYVVTIINSSNEKQRCRERISLAIIKGECIDDSSIVARTSSLPIALKKGERLWIYLTLEHDHFLYGTYDPLLGEREVEITIAGNTIKDTIPLNQELNPAIVTPKPGKPTTERLLDTEDYRGTSRETIAGRKGKFLYLAADIPGFQYFRFEDMHIKAGDTFELSFDYCIFVGTEGTCHVRVMEYQDTPNAWYRLEGGFDEMLGVETETIRTIVKKEMPQEENINNKGENQGVNDGENQVANEPKKEAKVIEEVKEETIIKKYNHGSWQKCKKRFRLLNDATTMAVDFRIVGTNVGEFCVDKIKLINLSSGDERP